MSVFATPSGLSSVRVHLCASFAGRWLQLQEGSCVQVYVQSTFDQYLILSLN